ncbi:MAG: hypothetical protein STSR0008_14170 [Ignavibacterium sp.]
MSTIKLKYKRDRKVFVPDKEMDLPDNYEINIPEALIGEKGVRISETSGQSSIREDFIQYYLHKYPGKSINDIDETLLELIGINADYSGRSSYKDDKLRVMEYLWEKYNV